MQSYAREHGLTEFISMQNLHNAIYREEEREMVPMLQDQGVGMIAWSPQAGGALSKPLDSSTARKEQDMYVLHARSLTLVEATISLFRHGKALLAVPFYETVNKK